MFNSIIIIKIIVLISHNNLTAEAKNAYLKKYFHICLKKIAYGVKTKLF
jgi:hypothetical protein